MIGASEFIKQLGQLVEALQHIDSEIKRGDKVTTNGDLSSGDLTTKRNLSQDVVTTNGVKSESSAAADKSAKPKDVPQPLQVTVKVDPISFAVMSVQSPLKSKDGDNTKTSFALASAIAMLEADDCGLDYEDVLSDLIDVLSVCSMRGLSKAFPMGWGGII